MPTVVGIGSGLVDRSPLFPGIPSVKFNKICQYSDSTFFFIFIIFIYFEWVLIWESNHLVVLPAPEASVLCGLDPTTINNSR